MTEKGYHALPVPRHQRSTPSDPCLAWPWYGCIKDRTLVSLVEAKWKNATGTHYCCCCVLAQTPGSCRPTPPRPYRGLPMMDENTERGASSPEKPALTMPEPERWHESRQACSNVKHPRLAHTEHRSTVRKLAYHSPLSQTTHCSASAILSCALGSKKG